jgi:peptide/nickel transport system ATP-binding protein
VHQNILVVNDLHTSFWNRKEQHLIRAVAGVDFCIPRGKTLGLIGESGSGKSVTARSIMGLVEGEPGVIRGEILFLDENNTEHNLLEGLNTELEYDGNGRIVKVEKETTAWLKQVENRMKPIRGKGISMIFQESSAALNPVFTVGELLVETIRAYHEVSRKGAKAEAAEWLHRVGINRPNQRLQQYPGELSGGMRQRVMIALALCSQPALLIADEPTTGLDATTQAMIIELLKQIKLYSDLSMLVITHDLGVIAQLADEVAVMYAGRTMESGSKSDILDSCQSVKHPYTGGLLAAVESMKPIPGDVRAPGSLSLGCRFSDRCAICEEKCQTEEPPLKTWQTEHRVRCWKADEWKQGQNS